MPVSNEAEVDLRTSMVMAGVLREIDSDPVWEEAYRLGIISAREYVREQIIPRADEIRESGIRILATVMEGGVYLRDNGFHFKLVERVEERREMLLLVAVNISINPSNPSSRWSTYYNIADALGFGYASVDNYLGDGQSSTHNQDRTKLMGKQARNVSYLLEGQISLLFGKAR